MIASTALRQFAAAMVAIIWFGTAPAQPLTDHLVHPREAEAARVATAWLALLTEGKAQESYAQLTDVFRSNMTLEQWTQRIERTGNDLGALRERTVRRVAYQDPKDAPLLGTYMAVEYDSVYERASKHFQYVVLHSRSGEPFRSNASPRVSGGGSARSGSHAPRGDVPA